MTKIISMEMRYSIGLVGSLVAAMDYLKTIKTYYYLVA